MFFLHGTTRLKCREAENAEQLKRVDVNTNAPKLEKDVELDAHNNLFFEYFCIDDQRESRKKFEYSCIDDQMESRRELHECIFSI